MGCCFCRWWFDRQIWWAKKTIWHVLWRSVFLEDTCDLIEGLKLDLRVSARPNPSDRMRILKIFDSIYRSLSLQVHKLLCLVLNWSDQTSRNHSKVDRTLASHAKNGGGGLWKKLGNSWLVPTVWCLFFLGPFLCLCVWVRPCQFFIPRERGSLIISTGTSERILHSQVWITHRKQLEWHDMNQPPW